MIDCIDKQNLNVKRKIFDEKETEIHPYQNTEIDSENTSLFLGNDSISVPDLSIYQSTAHSIDAASLSGQKI